MNTSVSKSVRVKWRSSWLVSRELVRDPVTGRFLEGAWRGWVPAPARRPRLERALVRVAGYPLRVVHNGRELWWDVSTAAARAALLAMLARRRARAHVVTFFGSAFVTPAEERAAIRRQARRERAA